MAAIFAFSSFSRDHAGGDLDPYFGPRSRNVYSSTCRYCKTNCRTEEYRTWIMDDPGEYQTDALSICQRCGWWSYMNDDPSPVRELFTSECAILRNFEHNAPEVPVSALISHLQRHGGRLADIHPAKFEELVGAVFSEYFGYRVEYCSYGRPDFGVDLVVVNSELQPILIQVKRYKRPIEADLIRQFAGAMVEQGQSKGVFVTSGRFRSGAHGSAEKFRERGVVEIDLVDGRRFLDFINVLNHAAKSAEELALDYWERALGERYQVRELIRIFRGGQQTP